METTADATHTGHSAMRCGLWSVYVILSTHPSSFRSASLEET